MTIDDDVAATTVEAHDFDEDDSDTSVGDHASLTSVTDPIVQLSGGNDHH